MPVNPGILTRRRLLGYALGSGVAGSTIGVGTTRMVQGVRPSISVLGDQAWQMSLVDVDRFRMLVCAGEPPSDVVLRTRRLMGAFRWRIDMLVAEEAHLPALRDHLEHRWAIDHFLSLGSELRMSGPPMITAPTLSVQTGAHGRIAVQTVIRGQWRVAAEGNLLPDWTIDVQQRGHSVVLTNRLESVLLGDLIGSAVVIAPGGPVALTMPRLKTGCIAVNASRLPEELVIGDDPTTDTKLVRVFPDDVARFEFRKSSVAIPPWHVPIPGS